MADTARAEALVQAIDRDAAFQTEVREARTLEGKRAVLDSHGFADVSVEDMRAFFESKGGTLNVPEAGEELSDAELFAVAGGLTTDEEVMVPILRILFEPHYDDLEMRGSPPMK